MAERPRIVDWPVAAAPRAANASPPVSSPGDASERAANLQLLARSIAHDFNNLISGILGHAMLIEDCPGADADIIESATIIRKTAERAAALNAQLMNLARSGAGRADIVDVHEAIREVADLVAPSMGRAICPELDLRAESAFVTGDAGQLHQALLNLAINARDAMPRGGRLIFSSETDSGCLIVRVADSGEGIPPALHTRIFEPLFTTKGEGRGTGLGLAVVKRIVEQHSGVIELESEAGRGATFTLRIPLREADTPAAAAAGLNALSAAAGS